MSETVECFLEHNVYTLKKNEIFQTLSEKCKPTVMVVE